MTEKFDKPATPRPKKRQLAVVTPPESSRSPYFPDSAPSSTKSLWSPHFFATSCVSFRALSSRTPLVASWAEVPFTECHRMRNQERGGGNDAWCQACHPIIDQALSHLRDCPVFQQEYQKMTAQRVPMDSTTISCCLELLESLLIPSRCLWHLCRNECFRKSFAPNREWLSLCDQIQHQEDQESAAPSKQVSRLISSTWSTRLVANKGGSCRVALVDRASGRTYPSSVASWLRRREKQSGATVRSRTNVDLSSSAALPSWSPWLFNIDSIESPLGLLEEVVADNLWHLLVVAACLQRTHRRQVDAVVHCLLSDYPTATSLCQADRADLQGLLVPLGLSRRRADLMIRMGHDFVQRKVDMEKDEVTLVESVGNLFGCGPYAQDVVRIFFLRQWRTVPMPADPYLAAYVDWKRGLQAGAMTSVQTQTGRRKKHRGLFSRNADAKQACL